MLAYEPDTVVVVTTSGPEQDRSEPVTLAQTIGRLIDTVQRFTLEADLARAEAINALAEAAPEATGKRKVDLLVVGPGDRDLGDALHFSPAAARRRQAIGRQVGAESLRRWRDEGRLPG
ncbi:MAG: hypothetical protein ACRDU8_07550 [Egibacteraceae bacterium]